MKLNSSLHVENLFQWIFITEKISDWIFVWYMIGDIKMCYELQIGQFLVELLLNGGFSEINEYV